MVGTFRSGARPIVVALWLSLLALLSACATNKNLGQRAESVDVPFTHKAHHVGGRFRNLGHYHPSPGGNWAKLAFDPYRKDVSVPQNHVLSQEQSLDLFNKIGGTKSSLTWIGHSTFLMRLGGLWILTDPVFSNRVSPVPPFGPKRLVQPGLNLKDLPKIDLILLSHNHYDHMDFQSLATLARLNPHTRVFVPLKNTSVVRRAGFSNIVEADWFDTLTYSGMKFTAVPAVHSSRRGLTDFNKSLWGGWSIKGGGHKIYFAGDTAKGSFIKEIRHRLGRHHIAMMPIGAYSPPEIEQGHHATPEESVAMARVMGARHVIPIHWGTFALTKEPIEEQRDRFLSAARAGPRPLLLRIGETIQMPH